MQGIRGKYLRFATNILNYEEIPGKFTNYSKIIAKLAFFVLY